MYIITCDYLFKIMLFYFQGSLLAAVYKEDGFSTTNYTLRNTTDHKLFINLFVHIPGPASYNDSLKEYYKQLESVREKHPQLSQEIDQAEKDFNEERERRRVIRERIKAERRLERVERARVRRFRYESQRLLRKRMKSKRLKVAFSPLP